MTGSSTATNAVAGASPFGASSAGGQTGKHARISAGGALSRLAGIVPSALSGSSTSSGSQVSAASVSSPPHQPPPQPGSAIDALEALASADNVRTTRYQSVRDASHTSKRADDETRSRDGADSFQHARAGSSGLWLNDPASRTANSSTFSAFIPGGSAVSAFAENSSHFFAPGAFSFEGDGGSSGFRSLASSQSLFGSHRNANNNSSAWNASEPTSSYVHSLGTSTPSDSSPANGFARPYNESLLGGGKKPKELSRGLRFAIASPSRDRGMVGLAKPREGDSTRVAVAGRTCLRLLSVPHGGRRRGRELQPTSVGSRQTQSIAYRRSRSRGVTSDSHAEEDSDGRIEREAVSETLDVRLGSRLGPAYLFSDVRWGHSASSNRLATSFTNGAVALWDLSNDTPIRVTHQIKYEHDRAVNRIVFGGQTGSWLMSGGQDGQMKLWDIREARPASIILKASSPVRHLAFSPSSAQPFTLLAACASGTLIRYDIRYTGRQGGGAIDRITGHVGSCLAMDWRDNHDSERVDTAGGSREGGWVVTGGVDKTIKIWDFSLATLSTKPVRTLHAAQPVQAVAWHPSRPTELMSCALPLLSTDSAADDSWPPVADKESLAQSSNSWKNEIDIWDTRRVHFPRLSVKTDEPITALLYNDDVTVWSVAKSTTTFYQHDINSDSYAPIDAVERPSAVWTSFGDVLFVDDQRHTHRSPHETPLHQRATEPVDSPAIRTESSINAVSAFDPDFSESTFAFLANNLVLGDCTLEQACNINAELYAAVDRRDCQQLWRTIRIWLDEIRLPPLVAPDDRHAAADRRSSTAKSERLASLLPNLLSPTSSDNPLSAVPLNVLARLGTSDSPLLKPTVIKSLSSPQLRGDATDDPSDFAADSPAGVDTGQTSEAPTPPIASGYGYYTSLSTPSSDSEQDLKKQPLKSKKGPSQGGSTIQVRDQQTGSAPFGPKHLAPDSNTDVDPLSLGSPAAPSAPRLPRRASSSSGSDSDSGADEKARRALALKAQSMANSIIDSFGRPRRGSDDPWQAAFSLDGQARPRQSSNKPSIDSEGRRMSHALLNGLQEGLLRQYQRRSSTGPSPAELAHAADEERSAEARQLMKDVLMQTMRMYADQGDYQLTATICCVLGDSHLKMPPFFVSRVTKAYLDHLRQAGLHIAAASVNKYCTPANIRALSQNSVTYHTACGKCGKVLDQPPYSVCPRCASMPTKCCICHQIVRSVLVWCPTCGHGGHAECLADFASSLAPSRSNSMGGLSSLVDTSNPSTPGIATPLRQWLWGENGDEDRMFEQSLELRRQRVEMLKMCPAGTCGHSTCLLSFVEV